MKLHAAGSSHWRKTDSLSLSQQWLDEASCSWTFTFYSVFWIDLEYMDDLTTMKENLLQKLIMIFFPPNNDALYAKMTTCWDLNGHYSTAVTGLDQIQHFVHNLRFLLVLVITYRKKLFQLISFIWIWFNNQTHGIHLWLGFQRKSLVIGGFIYSPNDYKTFKNYLVFGEGEVLLYVLRVA